MHSHQIFPCFRVAIWKVGLNLLEKQLMYNSDPSLCFDNDSAVNTY